MIILWLCLERAFLIVQVIWTKSQSYKASVSIFAKSGPSVLKLKNHLSFFVTISFAVEFFSCDNHPWSLILLIFQRPQDTSWEGTFSKHCVNGTRYLSYSLLEKTADISRSHRLFLRKMTSEVRVQEFHTDDVLLPWSGYCFLLVENLLQPIRSTHNPDLGSDASSIWNFCSRFSEVISPGNRWWRREMSAVFSGKKRRQSHEVLLKPL